MLLFLSFELQAVIAGRQGDLQRSQKLTKNANSCLVAGLILVAVLYFTVFIAGPALVFVVFFAIIFC